MWAAFGIVLSLGLALAAFARSRASAGTYYEEHVYGMDAAAHRRYAWLFGALGAYFAVDLGFRGRGSVPMAFGASAETVALASLILAAILYGATFLRGATGEDE